MPLRLFTVAVSVAVAAAAVAVVFDAVIGGGAFVVVAVVD